MSRERRREMVDRQHPALSAVRQCALLGISRSSLYYRSRGTSSEDLAVMKLIDQQYLATPFYQGSQFTGEAFTGLLEQHAARISMDGKGRYTDNIFVERLWRTVKYEEVYLKAYSNGREAKAGLNAYFRFYNTQRPHQALGYRTPAEVFSCGSDTSPEQATERGWSPDTALVYCVGATGPSLNLGIIYLFTHYRKHPASNRIARVSALIVASAASDRVSDSIKSASVASSYGLNIASLSMLWLAFRVAFTVASEARNQSATSSGGTILPARSMSALSLALTSPQVAPTSRSTGSHTLAANSATVRGTGVGVGTVFGCAQPMTTKARTPNASNVHTLTVPGLPVLAVRPASLASPWHPS